MSFELPGLFFAGPRKHPRSLLESHAREVILSYRKHQNQYLRCKMQSGRVLVGKVSYAGADSFFLQTGLAARQRSSYSALTAEPQPVFALDRRLLHGVEIAGIPLSWSSRSPFRSVRLPAREVRALTRVVSCLCEGSTRKSWHPGYTPDIRFLRFPHRSLHTGGLR
jgi:hypothetical protein